MHLAELADRRVAIWGYGREGRAALDVLLQQFPEKSIGLFCNEAEAAQALRDDAIFRRRSAHTEQVYGALTILPSPPDATALSAFDIVIKSPGISIHRSEVRKAQALGVRFTSGSAIWFAEHARARTIAVTGTKGKSTVTALIAHLLRARGLHVALAGNIGVPLLELFHPAMMPDWWAIELSSFQTRDFGGAPTIALITNLYDEHLDWHGTREKYVDDKLAIAARAELLLINGSQPELLARTLSHPNRIVFNIESGWHAHRGFVYKGVQPVLGLEQLTLPGLHNAHNVCAALAAVEAAGEDAIALARHVADFKPLPHRLQRLGARGGFNYINDSISTTPYASIEALRSLDGDSVTILVGGFDRGINWKVFVDYVAQHPPAAIITMGANGPLIAQALSAIANPAFLLDSVETLADAMAMAHAIGAADSTILLSPGAPSFDQFHDYAARGREFARLSGFDPLAIASIEGLGIG